MRRAFAVTAVLAAGTGLVFGTALLAAVLVPNGSTVPVQRQGILEREAVPVEGGFEQPGWGKPGPPEPPIPIPLAPDEAPVLPGPGAIAPPGGTAADPASIVAAVPRY